MKFHTFISASVVPLEVLKCSLHSHGSICIVSLGVGSVVVFFLVHIRCSSFVMFRLDLLFLFVFCFDLLLML